MEECAEIARQVGQRIGEELNIPVFLYEHAANKPERRNLADVRSGEYEGLQDKLARPEWKPDFGPATFNGKSGATAVGARSSDRREMDISSTGVARRLRRPRTLSNAPIWSRIWTTRVTLVMELPPPRGP